MAKKLKDTKAKKQTGVAASVLKSLIALCNGHKTTMDEARGELGAAVKKAEDVHGVHRRAFNDCRKLSRMEDAARADYLRAFDDYRVKLDLNSAPDLFEEGGDEATRRAAQAGKAAADDQAAENTTRLKGGITQLAH
ncbi:hypothetical protein [Methylobacterium sp. SI9]|uniref:hypothetical protein n=1 Tax=Methylobacterium guangdongense TaxID=3138811 RepID=UPI00313B53EA